MASDKLNKYLAYYHNVLREDDANVEARLRLAAIYREIGQKAQAVEHYVGASRQLAERGLPLEAIAACKAILEIEPSHTETQLFLARLFARVPDAGGRRIAKPVAADASGAIGEPVGAAASTPGAARLESVSHDEVAALEASGQRPITLKHTKAKPAHGLLDEPTTPFDEDGADLGLSGDGLDPALVALARADPRAEELITTNPLRAVDRGDVFIDDDDPPTGVLPRDALPQELRQTISDELTVSALLEQSAVRAPEHARDDDMLSRSVTARFHESVSRRGEELRQTYELDLGDVEILEMRGVRDTTPEPRVDDSASRRALRMPTIPLLSHLRPEVLAALISKLDLRHVPAGEVILQPGHRWRSLFIVVRGQADVLRRNDQGDMGHIDDLCEGDFFGEFGLLTGRAGSAVVRASTPMELLVITAGDLHALAKIDPKIWDTLWDFYHERLLNNLLTGNYLFGSLNSKERTLLSEFFEIRRASSGDLLFDRQAPCRHMCIVALGGVQLEHRGPEGGLEHLSLREGQYFGVLDDLPRGVELAVRATREATVLLLHRATFQTCVDRHPVLRQRLDEVRQTRQFGSAEILLGATSYHETGLTR